MSKRWVSNCMRGHEDRWATGGARIIIGEPRPTEKYTTEQLASFGLVGVYVLEEDGDDAR